MWASLPKFWRRQMLRLRHCRYRRSLTSALGLSALYVIVRQHPLYKELRRSARMDYPLRLLERRTPAPFKVGTPEGWNAVRGREVIVWQIWNPPKGMKDPPLLMLPTRGSCQRFMGPNDLWTVVDEASVERWISKLHPSYHLLSKVHRSDYLRQELLYEYGGWYLDNDVICLHDPTPTLRSQVAAYSNTFTRPSRETAYWTPSIGPFQPRSEFGSAMHSTLWATMDAVTPRLEWCLWWHGDGSGGIAYPDIERANNTICKVGWAWIMDPSFVPYMEILERNASAFGAGVLQCNLDCCRFNRSLKDRDFFSAEGDELTIIPGSGPCDTLHLCNACDSEGISGSSLEELCGTPTLLHKGQGRICEALQAGRAFMRSGH